MQPDTTTVKVSPREEPHMAATSIDPDGSNA
jgi:hypothetical protein